MLFLPNRDNMMLYWIIRLLIYLLIYMLLLDYVTNRKQRSKIGSSFSSWCAINTGVPQGSIIGTLLFNIFVNDLFLAATKSEFCNFADDNTLYSCHKNLKHVFSNLKYDLRNVLDWFKIISMNSYSSKFQFMVLGVKYIAPFRLNVNGKIIPWSNEVKLLQITIDNELKFKKHSLMHSLIASLIMSLWCGWMDVWWENIN